MADALVQNLATQLLYEAEKYGVSFPATAAKYIAQTVAKQARQGVKEEVEHPQQTVSITGDGVVTFTGVIGDHPYDEVNWASMNAPVTTNLTTYSTTSIAPEYGTDFMVQKLGEGWYSGQIMTKVKPVQCHKSISSYDLSLVQLPDLIIQDVIEHLTAQLQSDAKAAGMFLATDITVSQEKLLDPSCLHISAKAWAGYPVAPLPTD